MPGGYARVARSPDATAIAMQHGGSVADVWVISDKPVRNETLLPSPVAPYSRARLGELPSRAADNLYWMGRYVERAEGLIRMLRAWHVRRAEGGRENTPLLVHASAYPGFYDADPADGIPRDLFDAIDAATTSANQVRDRFSADAWIALNELAGSARAKLARVRPGYATARVLGQLLWQITGFSGLVHDNMYRFAGWRFLTIGRALERASMMAKALAWFPQETAPEGALDLVVEFGDSVLSHRRLYAVATSRLNVIDLLGCDANNPRSIHYQLAELKDHISFLPGTREAGQMSELSRAILKLHADVAVKTPELMTQEHLVEIDDQLAALSNLITMAYLR
jgi:uncharacterized alpha-E superfamily protein